MADGVCEHVPATHTHQNEAKWRNTEPWVSIEGQLWDLLAKQTDIPSVIDAIKATCTPKAHIAEVVEGMKKEQLDKDDPDNYEACFAIAGFNDALEAVRSKLLG